MVDISHSTGNPNEQKADLTDFFRAMFKDAGAVGSKIASPFMKGDGTRAVNPGIQGVAAMPTPSEPPGVDPSIGASPDDSLPNVPVKAPVTSRPLPPINKFPGTDAEQMQVPIRQRALRKTDAEQMAGAASPATAALPDLLRTLGVESEDELNTTGEPSEVSMMLLEMFKKMLSGGDPRQNRFNAANAIPGVNQRRSGYTR